MSLDQDVYLVIKYNNILKFIGKDDVNMMTREKLIKKVENLDNQLVRPSLLITVIELPTKAKEVITNTEFLDEKIKYILDAYDENLNLRTCPNIKLLDCIIL